VGAYRDQGLSAKQLNIVFDAIILSRNPYGVCADWSGFFLSAELIGRIDAFLRRMFRYGFCKHLIITFRDISDNCDKLCSFHISHGSWIGVGL
jgi:hypothetical protein